MWKLSATDLCEVARNSVLHSGFPHQVRGRRATQHCRRSLPSILAAASPSRQRMAAAGISPDDRCMRRAAPRLTFGLSLGGHALHAQGSQLAGCRKIQRNVRPLLATVPAQVKMHWVHTHYWKLGPEGNDIQKTNVPALRMRFR